MNHLAGPIPHQYVRVDATHTHHPDSQPADWIDGEWFALQGYPGEAWSCHVLLDLPEGGAVRRAIPLHALAQEKAENPKPNWQPWQAATWDCYSPAFVVPRYSLLEGLRCKARIRAAEGVDKWKDYFGHMLFAIKPAGDAFSRHPGQDKEFYLIALDNGRYTLQPTNHVLLEDLSFTARLGRDWPRGLRRSEETFSAE
jgi:hypothetical protein